MKPNAVVYGLGKYYEVRKNKIKTKYHIMGHCDQKIKFSEVYQDFVSPTDLCNIDFDFIIKSKSN